MSYSGESNASESNNSDEPIPQHLGKNFNENNSSVDETCTNPSAKLPSPLFSDQYDAYLYQSHHITTPILNTSKHITTPPLTPQLTLQFPPEEEEEQKPVNLLHLPPERKLDRRASHSCNFTQPNTSQPDPRSTPSPLLELPLSRDRGRSLPENLSSCELYKLRNFSICGRKVINKGDSYKSRKSSCSSIGSR